VNLCWCLLLELLLVSSIVQRLDILFWLVLHSLLRIN